MASFRGIVLAGVIALIGAVVALPSGTASATCDSSVFHLTVTDETGNPATEPDGTALPAHRLPDGGVSEGYLARITITGGDPPYTTGWGGYSLPPGVDKSISSSPGTSNNDIVTISGSSSESYAASLILTVLDKNGCGPTPADSRFDWLYGETPTNGGPSPSIPDPISVGDQPSCSPGAWLGDSNYRAISYTYEWRRDNGNGTSTTVGSQQTYRATTADAGLHLSCFVTATNKFGSTQAISNSVRVRYPPKNVEPPELLYYPKVVTGNELHCYRGNWVGAQIIAYSFRWIVRRADGDHVVSTDPDYTPTEADAHGYVHCEVTASNQDGKVTLPSNTLKVLRRAHLDVTFLPYGWRSTGNMDLMRHGGPLSEATPQQYFFQSGSDTEAGVVVVTLRNTGDVPSLADGAGVVAGYGEGQPPKPYQIPSVNPGQSIEVTLPLTPELHYLKARPERDATYHGEFGFASFDEKVPEGDIKGAGATTIYGSVLEPPSLPTTELDAAVLKPSSDAEIMRVRRHGCRWVAGRSGKLMTVREKGSVCATPVWIRAQVHGRKWTLRFKHPLAPGRYVLYTRAIDKTHVFNPFFSAKDHNRLAFTVR